MKKSLILILSAALMICGCSSMRLTPEEKAQIETTVQENLDNRKYVIEVDQMVPLRGGSRHVTNYSVEVDGDKLKSHLPYFGAAWNLPYGGGQGLTFESNISDYVEYSPKADRRQIALSTNNGEDRLVYIIEVFNNGRTTIEVRSRNRETIHYYGDMKTIF